LGLGALFVSLVFAHGFALARYLHMFQLNGYKLGVQLRWIARNKGDYLKKSGAGLTAIAVCLTASGVARGLALFLVLVYVNTVSVIYWKRPRPKKPLVYTNRVKRLLATHTVLFILGLVALSLAFHVGMEGLTAYMASMYALTPWFALLADWVNSPLEKRINRWYVEDARRLLTERLLVVGVTGSWGKTSVKFFLSKLLSLKYNVLMTPENFNTTLGVVRALRERSRPFHEVFVCEMGARNPGDVAEICELVRPALGVITSIGPQHLESFKTLENVARTKFELADAVGRRPGGAVFLNLSSEPVRVERARRNWDGGPEAISFGFAEDCDYRAAGIRVSEEGTSFVLRFPDRMEILFETRLIGEHNVTNILAAVAVADRLGVARDALAAGVRRLESVPHRLRLIRSGDDIVIDDAYNSNAVGAKAALDALALFNGCKILVTPGMVELGERQDELNRTFGTQAGAVCDFAALVGGRQTASVRQGLKDAGFPQEKIFTAERLEQALAWVASIKSETRKIILLENDLPDNYI
jgi:UDP-N-acetylmuramoyl-tripeptide--D-alanyl-D-alanine ligase